MIRRTKPEPNAPFKIECLDADHHHVLDVLEPFEHTQRNNPQATFRDRQVWLFYSRAYAEQLAAQMDDSLFYHRVRPA